MRLLLFPTLLTLNSAFPYVYKCPSSFDINSYKFSIESSSQYIVDLKTQCSQNTPHLLLCVCEKHRYMICFFRQPLEPMNASKYFVLINTSVIQKKTIFLFLTHLYDVCSFSSSYFVCFVCILLLFFIICVVNFKVLSLLLKLIDLLIDFYQLS